MDADKHRLRKAFFALFFALSVFIGVHRRLIILQLTGPEDSSAASTDTRSQFIYLILPTSYRLTRPNPRRHDASIGLVSGPRSSNSQKDILMTASTRATANLANAQLSTGPRTEEGKSRSSRNAVKHGLTAKHLVIGPGEEEEFAELHDSLLAQLSPQGPLEMGLFNMLCHAAWNLERFRALEAQLMTSGLDSLLDERTAKALDRLQRYAASNQRAYFSALKELRTVQNNRLLRLSQSGKQDGTPLPELVSIVELTKRTQQLEANAKLTDWLAMEAYINAPMPGRRQNEAMPDLSRLRQEVA